VEPLLPLGGYAGWRFLSSSLESQMARFADSPAQARDIAYFREKIAGITDAGALVSDFRALRVALGAFGLQDDLPNRAFIRCPIHWATKPRWSIGLPTNAIAPFLKHSGLAGRHRRARHCPVSRPRSFHDSNARISK